MAIIRGTTEGIDGALAGVLVECKNERFETVYQTVSDESGRFSLFVPDGTYPFLTAVRDYGERYLEYWAQDLPAYGELTLNARIDTLEVYGLHAFVVKGAANALTVYFRPMSLQKFRSGEPDIAPTFRAEHLSVAVDGRPCKVYTLDRVREYAGEGNGFLTACLMQTSVPGVADEWKRLDMCVRDGDGHFGCATLFRRCSR